MPSNKQSIPQLEALQKQLLSGDESFLRHALAQMLDLLMNLEVSEQINATKHERTGERKTYRNGTRERTLATGVGEVTLNIPKLRKDTYYPSFLEPRRMVDKALVNVIKEAYVNGVSTRKVDKLVEDLGLKVDKSAVSRFCKELDAEVVAFKNRPLEGHYPYLWLDATYLKVRENNQVKSMALVVAMATDMEGNREILGFDIGQVESYEFWKEFLQSLLTRGLTRTELVISDAHEGLKKAIAAVFHGAVWQRCRVHTMRNILCHVPKKQQALVSAMVKTIFYQDNQQAAKIQLRHVVTQLETQFPKAMAVLESAEDDVTAYMAFPKAHHRQLHSTNPLERLNREIKRRSNVVSIFPNSDAVIRLVGAILIDQQDEWLCAERRYFSHESLEELREQLRLDVLPTRGALLKLPTQQTV